MTNEADELQEELATFNSHRAELFETHAGQYALVHNSRVLGVFGSEVDAVNAGYLKLGNVPFLVMRIQAVDIPQYFTSPLVAS